MDDTRIREWAAGTLCQVPLPVTVSYDLIERLMVAARSLLAEQDSEILQQGRLLLSAAIKVSDALHNEELQGAELKASTDTAWENLSFAIESAAAIRAGKP